MSYYWNQQKMKELKDKGLKLTNYYVRPICKEPTKPDEWSNDRYSCIDCGPIPNRERGIGT